MKLRGVNAELKSLQKPWNEIPANNEKLLEPSIMMHILK